MTESNQHKCQKGRKYVQPGLDWGFEGQKEKIWRSERSTDRICIIVEFGASDFFLEILQIETKQGSALFKDYIVQAFKD